MFGSLLTALNPAVGLIALAPALGAAGIGGLAWFGVRRFDDEKTIYKQIGDRLSAIVKAIE